MDNNNEFNHNHIWLFQMYKQNNDNPLAELKIQISTCSYRKVHATDTAISKQLRPGQNS